MLDEMRVILQRVVVGFGTAGEWEGEEEQIWLAGASMFRVEGICSVSG